MHCFGSHSFCIEMKYLILENSITLGRRGVVKNRSDQTNDKIIQLTLNSFMVVAFKVQNINVSNLTNENYYQIRVLV